MRSVMDNAWFYWAIAVAVGLPVLLVALTELRNVLERRGNGWVGAISLLRNFIVPLGALLILLVKANEVSAEATSVRIIATVFGFVVLILMLSGLNTTLFQGAPEGSWRQRIPTIFLDVARFVVIAVGLAMIFSFVWGADVGGLFTALGVTSIVLGLALQNAVGQIISGLLLLFEQPFRIGDWVDTSAARGRVVEVNWRATHIETGSGLQIIPNSVLAGGSFTNLSRPAGSHAMSVATTFAHGDAPDEVCAMLTAVAARLPQLRPDAAPKTVTNGAGEFKTSIPLRSPADDGAARGLFLRWIWYAARRVELHLDGVDDDFATPQRLEKALRTVAPTLRLGHAELQALAGQARLIRYGAEEPLQTAGQVPRRLGIVVNGRVKLAAPGRDGSMIPIRTLESGEFVGQTALTREPSSTTAIAVGEVTILQLDRDDTEDLVSRNPTLLQLLGQSIAERHDEVRRALLAHAN